MRRRAAARKSLAEEMITPAPSIGGEERAAREVERGDRIVPVLRRLHRLEIQIVERAVDDFLKTDRRIGGGDAVYAEGELVELPHALPLVLAQRIEDFEQLDRMDRPGDQIVVPASEVVVHVHAEQPAVIDRELRRVGDRKSTRLNSSP